MRGGAINVDDQQSSKRLSYPFHHLKRRHLEDLDFHRDRRHRRKQSERLCIRDRRKLGIAMNFMSTEVRCTPGIEFCSKTMLRAGIALLGLRITLPQILSLGWPLVAFVALSVILTIAVSMLAARALRFDPLFGLLTGGATAICGASAALALSSAMPPHPQKERATMLTVIAVSTLSTLAMVAYPTIARWMALEPHSAGIFLGGTIHDVAQVVGAGYSMSQETGATRPHWSSCCGSPCCCRSSP